MDAADPMRVLIVDDSSTMRRIIANTLKKIGFDEIVDASDGAEALEQYGSAGADLILTDWNMPKMSGPDFVSALRQLPGADRIPVLMVTINAEKENVVHALDAGVNDYVVKPFTADTLREKIQALLAK